MGRVYEPFRIRVPQGDSLTRDLNLVHIKACGPMCVQRIALTLYVGAALPLTISSVPPSS